MQWPYLRLSQGEGRGVGFPWSGLSCTVIFTGFCFAFLTRTCTVFLASLTQSSYQSKTVADERSCQGALIGYAGLTIQLRTAIYCRS